MVLVIDNYDSFTHNIVQYLLEMGEEVKTVRNDMILVEDVKDMDIDRIVISPGPGYPKSAGVSLDMIKAYTGRKPIFGVCLGHQSIGEAFGAKIVKAKKIMHGKRDMITHDGKTIFRGLPNPLSVIRYHSLVIDESTLSPDFEVSARSSDGQIMAIRHREFRVEGVQFHPESIGTEAGKALMRNFFSFVDSEEKVHARVLVKKVVQRENLSSNEAERIVEAMADGELTSSQIGSALTALTMKGETVDEIAGFARALRKRSIHVPVSRSLSCVDTCGTGGDSRGTFNISTISALVAAGAGVKVAKHGNRSITSKAGSADVLESLGVPIGLSPEKSAEVIEKTGMSFLFAQGYHPAFKNIAAPRKELGFRTVFNILGPLLNPAGARRQLMGVFDGSLTETIARVLLKLETECALVVHGSDGLDEITLTGTTRMTELRSGWIRTYDFDPRVYGFEYCQPSDLKGGDAAENASIVERILAGEHGPKRDVVLLNAAAAIIVSQKTDSFADAIEMARNSIDSMSARNILSELRSVSRER